MKKSVNKEVKVTMKELTDILEVRRNEAMQDVEKMMENKEFGITTKTEYLYDIINGNKDCNQLIKTSLHNLTKRNLK